MVAPGLESSIDATRLLAAARDLAAAHDLPRIMEIVRRAARDLTRADGVTFVLREGPTVHYADEDAIAPLWKGRRFPAEACISGYAMIHRQAVVIEDIYQDARVPHDAYRETFVKSMAMVPVRREDPVAAIGVYWARQHRATEREVSLVESLAGLTSVALANVALVSELREAVRARDEFLSLAAHELRTPLTPLALQLGWALRALDRDDAATARDAIARTQRNVQRTSELVRELLESAAVVAGEERLVLHREELDLAALGRDVLARLRAEQQARIRLTAPDELRGTWDARHVAQILDKLVSNALKFGADGPVEVSLVRAGASARITVTDHGMGIAPEDQARIFGRFERAASPRHFGGLGLGLWLVRHYVEAHGGSLVVDSRPGEGSTFTVVLPGAHAVPRPASAAHEVRSAG